MNKSRVGFFGRVLISRGIVAGFVVGGIAIWLLMPAIYWVSAIPALGFELAWSFAWDEANHLHVGYAVIGAMAYGLFRATMFHPLIHRQYGVWLAQTPWRYPSALPLGPLRLVAPDAILVGMMTLVAALPPAEWNHIYLVLVAFLVSYSAGLSLAHLRRQSRWSLAICVFLTGVVLLTIRLPMVSLGIAVLLTCAISPAIVLSLHDFPYSETERRALRLMPARNSERGGVRWLAAFMPGQDPEWIDLRWLAAPAVLQKWRYDVGRIDGLLIGAAVGWAIFCVTFHNSGGERVGTQMVLHGYLTAFLLLSRLWAYVAGHWPPISLAGRVATGRLIIPTYDVVFAAPALAIAVSLVLPKALIGIGVWPFIAWPITSAVTTAILLGTPPRYETWHFTGHFRQTVGNVDSRKFIQA